MAKWNPRFGFVQSQVDDGLWMFSNTDPKNNKVLLSYFLQTRTGNVLFHGPNHKKFYTEFQAFFEEAGGVQHHVFTHAPEVEPATLAASDTFGATNWLHRIDVDFLRANVRGAVTEPPPDKGWLTNVKAVHLPGHMPGFNGYLVKRGGTTYLIGGDFITTTPKGWTARVHELLKDYGFESLSKLRKMKCDYLLPNQTYTDRPPPWPMDPASRGPMLDEVEVFMKRKFKIRN